MPNAITLTREYAFASGQDAANRQMRKAGRSAWNDADFDLAADTTNGLLLHVPFEHGGLQGLPREILLHHVSVETLDRTLGKPASQMAGHNGGPALHAP